MGLWRVWVVFAVVAMVLGGCAMPARHAEAREMVMPPRPWLVNRAVVVDVVRVDGQRWPGRSMEAAVETLSGYCAGGAKLGRVADVASGQKGVLSHEKVDELVRTVERPGAGVLTIALVPEVESYDEGGAAGNRAVTQSECGIDPATGRDELRSVIVVRGRQMEETVRHFWVVSRRAVWRDVLVHEMGHALGLPGAADHVAEGDHCTNPECALYHDTDWRFILTALVRLGPPTALCRECREELAAQRRAGGGLSGPPEGGYARAWMDELVRRNPSNADAYWWRADFHARAREYEAAAADFERFVAMRPDSAAGRNNLAWAIVNEPQGKRDATRAVKLSREACERTAWKNATYVHTLAAGLWAQGDRRGAAEMEAKAVAVAGKGAAAAGMEKQLAAYRAAAGGE